MGMIINPYAFASKVQTLVDRTAGSLIGNMTNSGGNAAAFDGTTSQNNSQSAASSGSVSSSYVGKTWASPKIFHSATLYPSNAAGFAGSGAPNVTVNVRGKNGAAPTGPTDGMLIGTTGSISDTTSSVGITSTDNATTWDHWIVEVVPSSTESALLAEVVWNEWA